ncbi:MAG: sugar transferase [Candidatus Omnitrophota bacterium]
MKRVFDLILASILLCFLSVPIFVVALIVKLTSEGPVIYWSDRVGINNCIFSMPKFRTMRVGTPDVATHLMKNPKNYLTPIGFFLRNFSVDELPQLYSIFRGDISFVGPRPALHNQEDLIKLRTEKGIDKIIPGITGWAQINGRDDLSVQEKVDFEEYYLQKRSVFFDLKILLMTPIKVMKREGISH